MAAAAAAATAVGGGGGGGGLMIKAGLSRRRNSGLFKEFTFPVHFNAKRVVNFLPPGALHNSQTRWSSLSSRGYSVKKKKPFINRTNCFLSSSSGTDKGGLNSDFQPLHQSQDVDDGNRKEESISNGHHTTDKIENELEKIPPPYSSELQDIRRELITLSVPALLGQVIDPLALLMETSYIGRLGSLELASTGVSMTLFNNISKLFNIPLLGVATSFVAEDIAKSTGHVSVTGSTHGSIVDGLGERPQLSSVSTALTLAIAIGIFEALALHLGSGFLLNAMGVPSASPMHTTARQFLCLRAFGAPAFVVSLALQGILRGFKDTKTPLYCLGFGNFTAIILFPLLMNYCRLGVAGAAISTVISQYLVAFSMIYCLSKRTVLLPPKFGELQFGCYLKSGGFLIGRTLAVLTTMTLAASMAARQGPVAMAAHQICFQVWLAVSLIADALAASSQALIASYYSKGKYTTVKEVTQFVLKIGIFAGVSLAVVLSLSFNSLSTFFTKDAEVLKIVATGVLFVSASQPINALAFIFDGLHYGVSDFPYAACSMMLVGAISSVVLLYAPSRYGLPGVWSGLTLFMALRMVAGFFRIMSRESPWWFLHGGDYNRAKLAGSGI
ncbi:OLC1v1005348C4 [Oldenlandia corymbosa var. corymbosa]|uniref:Protein DETOXIFICATION n=1 Tax=Oldenlandia corymbosa var. corymbosa TaxID=529605 RepID=A0AAV1DEL5_OLDCO|nr:OLC1v1005348C4 [Oldenlandia corymbosa var. corymbosa]